MQEPSGGSDPTFRKPKSQKKQAATLQPKVSVQLSSIRKGKSTAPKAAKAPRKTQKAVKKVSVINEVINNNTSMVPAKITRPVVDMLGNMDGDNRNLYRTLKRKYLLLEEESYVLAEELEKTEAEVKQLQEEKSALLDELLVLEGLAFNPYPPFEPLNKDSQAPPLG